MLLNCWYSVTIHDNVNKKKSLNKRKAKKNNNNKQYNWNDFNKNRKDIDEDLLRLYSC